MLLKQESGILQLDLLRIWLEDMAFDRMLNFLKVKEINIFGKSITVGLLFGSVCVFVVFLRTTKKLKLN